MKTNYLIPSLLLILVWLPACQKTTGPTPQNVSAPTEQQIRDAVSQRFVFTPNRLFSATYLCGRRGSNLAWHFRFHDNGQLKVLFTTDTYDDFVFDGSYTYERNEIRISMPGGTNQPFLYGLDEPSRVIMPQFGLLAGFATDEMICICEGHELNPQAPPVRIAHYDCPEINIQAATYEDNAVEFGVQTLPFNQTLNGSIFRHQDTYISGRTNPVIRRGYGIYRQDGDDFWATFSLLEDFLNFAGDQLPFPVPGGLPFDDFNLLSGHFENNEQAILIDQLSPETGPCQLE